MKAMKGMNRGSVNLYNIIILTYLRTLNKTFGMNNSLYLTPTSCLLDFASFCKEGVELKLKFSFKVVAN